MQFKIDDSLKILERTPGILQTLLSDLDSAWIMGNEGGATWSPYDIVGHLIHGEKTDWVPRMQIIVGENGDKRFAPFNRFAQFEDSKDKTLDELLEEFALLRSENLALLKKMQLTGEMLKKKGIHPEFGEVTLEQLLATWVVHDLSHLSQVSRVMAVQYREQIGPWTKYFRIFNPQL